MVLRDCDWMEGRTRGCRDGRDCKKEEEEVIGYGRRCIREEEEVVG